MSSQGGAAAAAAPAARRPGGPQQQQQQAPDWKLTILRAVAVYMVMQLVIGPNGFIARWYGLDKKANNTNGTAAPASPSQSETAPDQPSLGFATSLWPLNQTLDLYVFLAEGPPPDSLEVLTQRSLWTPYGQGPWAGASAIPNIDFSAPEYQPLLQESSASTPLLSKSSLNRLPAVKFPSIAYNQPKLEMKADFGEFPISQAVRTGNHSIWAELFLTVKGASPNPSDPNFSPLAVHRQRKLLTRLFARKRRRVERNLFDKSNATDASVEDEAEEEDFDDKNPPIGAHWHRNLTLGLVPFQSSEPRLDLTREQNAPSLQYVYPVLDPAQAQQAAQIAAVDHRVRFQLPVYKGQDGKDDAYYYPVVFPNDFWLLRGHMNPINHTVKALPLHINLYSSTPTKFRIQAQMNEGWERAQNGQATGLGGQAGTAEIDMLKSILLETSPWWLILTMIVTILHSVFEMLAFSSDIGDWRKKQDLSGISIGSILTNVITQVIILLYLVDSSEETSYVIILGQGMGAAIEAWKLTKAVKVAVVPTPADAKGVLSVLPYQVKILNKRVLSEEEKKTQEFDRLAFRIVGVVAVPVLGAWTVYSALYNEHRGWWSFCIQTLTSFVYAFGFVSLVPQLIVNYKLKSTAGFSPKTLIYKILGTFVDDMFAFAVPQPMLHRLACFRDDIIFFIFLYQRWIYGVDPTRKNELGEVVDKEGAKRKELAASEKKEKDEVDDGAAASGNGTTGSTAVEKESSTAASTKSRKKGGR
ncbi:hypothetical protein OC846_002650 [Tilletia horrida]|uniref:Cleft lip and palate transmembrane protein 1 n=1 Tax=Tilletia horrida TaxID=155126 RepID=A0AAN6GRS8_9BASI|nr:hypothetical protein OC846_002650 [Tilletia horrida]KAK0569728.1 hypothetical protein OC861_000690 [Tilletia horrida]